MTKSGERFTARSGHCRNSSTRGSVINSASSLMFDYTKTEFFLPSRLGNFANCFMSKRWRNLANDEGSSRSGASRG